MSKSKRVRMKRQPTKKQINTALAAVRSFCRIGRSSLKDSERLPWGNATRLAKQAGLTHAELLRMARRVAGVYTDDAIYDLSTKCHKYGFLLGRTHLIRLAPLNVTVRKQLQNKMVLGNWTLVELENAIAQKVPPPLNVGRLPWVPKEGAGLLAQIKSHCNRWRRWSAAVLGKLKGALPGLDQQKAENIRRQIKAAFWAVGRLEQNADLGESPG